MAMTENQFKNYMFAVVNGIDAGDNYHDTKTNDIFNQHARWALKKLEFAFDDKENNIRRWLNNKPCVFKSPSTGVTVNTNLGSDTSALYYFLIYCDKLRKKEQIDPDFMEFLEYTIRDSRLQDEIEFGRVYDDDFDDDAYVFDVADDDYDEYGDEWDDDWYDDDYSGVDNDEDDWDDELDDYGYAVSCLFDD